MDPRRMLRLKLAFLTAWLHEVEHRIAVQEGVVLDAAVHVKRAARELAARSADVGKGSAAVATGDESRTGTGTGTEAGGAGFEGEAVTVEHRIVEVQRAAAVRARRQA